MKQDVDKKASFGRFWKKNGKNLLFSLVLCVAVCIWLGTHEPWSGLALPIWILIALVFWGCHMGLLFRAHYRAEQRDGIPPEE